MSKDKKYYAKVSLIDGNLVFESLVSEIVEKKIYPTGGDRIGTVVTGSKEGLAIEKAAIEPLKKLFEDATPEGSLGDIDWFISNDDQFNFSWLGPLTRTFTPGEEVVKARGSVCGEAIAKKQFIEI